MEDSSWVSCPSRRLKPTLIASKKQLGNCLVASPSKGFSQKTLKYITSVKEGVLGNGAAGDIGMFIVKTVALEIVRRYSRAKRPIVRRGLQALQVLCYLPFKWIQTWDPIKALVKYMQAWSKPLLVLTIATIFSNQSACKTEKLDSLHDFLANSELLWEPSSQLSISDTTSFDEVTASVATKRWLQQLHKDLEKQGITLPERLNDDELCRFYAATNGEFLRLLSSIKKTIRWRQTYTFLSPQELEAWSHLVFWHGYDVQLRPCLVIRLGLAFSNLRSDDRELFAKAVGMHVFLINIIRRTTQQKLLYAGENYRVVVSKYPQTPPSFLGGNCLCQRCLDQVDMPHVNAELVPMRPRGHLVVDQNEPSLQWYDHLIDAMVSQNGDQMKRIAIMGILMMWICVAFVLARHYPDTLTLFELAL